MPLKLRSVSGFEVALEEEVISQYAQAKRKVLLKN
jgi:hypothetical protein